MTTQAILQTYQALISMDFADDASMIAAQKYPNNLQQAIDHVIKMNNDNNTNLMNSNNKQKMDNTSGDYHRDRYRSRQCGIVDCPFLHADSIPNHAIIPDHFSEQDKAHMKQFHPTC